MSVTAAGGFRAAGVSAGLRIGSQLPDVALVVNDGPSPAAAGVFTANQVKAAPVLWSQEVLRGGEVRAVLLNAGGANACTGPDGFADTHRSAEHVAQLLGCGAAEVAVCSTGLIGERLPLEALLAGATRAAGELSGAGGVAAADAIRTTDTRSKTATRQGGGVTVGGMAKGAGMLAPSLATMLCVVTTDAMADAALLDKVLREATARTFDRLDTDGCLSTNDTVLLLASGASGVEVSPDLLAGLVHDVCDDLAEQLLRDAEGATKWLRIVVSRAADEAEALAVARSVARSNLVKTAVHGSDPNWGRIVSAAGAAAATVDPQRIAVAVNGVWVCRDGCAAEPRSSVDMSGADVHVVVDLGIGSGTATIRTTDLSAAYVHENSAYST